MAAIISVPYSSSIAACNSVMYFSPVLSMSGKRLRSKFLINSNSWTSSRESGSRIEKTCLSKEGLVSCG